MVGRIRMKLKYIPKTDRPWSPEKTRFGRDAISRDQHIAWQRHRCQARFRGESYELSFDEWQELWRGQWHLRGRGSTDLCLTRIDFDGEWAIHNVVVCSRKRHFELLGQHRDRSKL